MPRPLLLGLALLLPLALPCRADPEGGRRDRQQALGDLYGALAKGTAAALTEAEAGRRNALLAEVAADPPVGEPLVRTLRELAGQAVRQAERQAASEALRKLAKANKEALVKARKDALAVIFDLAVYPEADHGASGQPRVDAEVAKVRDLYRPYVVLARPEGPVGRPLAAAREILAALGALGVTDPPAPPDEEALAARLDGAFARLLSPPEDFRALEACRKALAGSDPEVLACFEETNRYRMMMGLPPLAVDPKLMAAAQKHSEDMLARGYFDHFSPEGKSPFDRVRAEGFDGMGGENIATGPTTGAGAVDGWLHSSGHHRNILKAHFKLLGVGKADTLWTQNFGIPRP